MLKSSKVQCDEDGVGGVRVGMRARGRDCSGFPLRNSEQPHPLHASARLCSAIAAVQISVSRPALPAASPFGSTLRFTCVQSWPRFHFSVLSKNL